MAAYTAIDNPELYFQVKAYSGTGSSNAVTLDGDEDMAPNLVWIKRRSGLNDNHSLGDTVRGVQKRLRADTSDAEDTQAQHITAFSSDGFTVGTGGAVNGGSDTYVAWCWKESATAGFDIIAHTHSGDSSEPSHSLGAAPNFIVFKPRGATGSWGIATTPTGITSGYLGFGTAAFTSSSGFVDAADASTITYGEHLTDTTHITYAWRSIQGFSKTGSFTGNGNADGAFVYTGFRPAFIMTKNTARSDNWMIFDNKRLGYNVDNNFLFPNLANAEVDSDQIDNLSNGFKCRSANDAVNSSGELIIYMAFAEAPFVNSEGVPANAR